jgi:hypothetical protein
MTDRELLELAAKAADIEIDHWRTDPMISITEYDSSQYCMWNPLTDDGDALRLAVKLCLFIQINSGSATAWKWRGENWYEQASDNADDMRAATRRAITRAAAEIGRSKE